MSYLVLCLVSLAVGLTAGALIWRKNVSKVEAAADAIKKGL